MYIRIYAYIRRRGALQPRIHRYGLIRFARVHERVSTKSLVVLSIGNSKSNHLDAQGIFNSWRLPFLPSPLSRGLRGAGAHRGEGQPVYIHRYIHTCMYAYIYIYTYIHTVKTRRWECDRTGSRTHVLWVHDWGQYHSSERVSCDEWDWNPSPDISGYMCGSYCSQHIRFNPWRMKPSPLTRGSGGAGAYRREGQRVNIHRYIHPCMHAYMYAYMHIYIRLNPLRLPFLPSPLTRGSGGAGAYRSKVQPVHIHGHIHTCIHAYIYMHIYIYTHALTRGDEQALVALY